MGISNSPFALAHLNDLMAWTNESGPAASEAIDEIVSRHLGLVISLVDKFQLTNVELREDAIEEGKQALIEAIKDFDPSRGKFSTFVWWRIRKAIQIVLKEEIQQHNIIKLAENWWIDPTERGYGSMPWGGDPYKTLAAKNDRENISRWKETLNSRHAALIEDLIWDGKTQSAVAAECGIDRRRVNDEVKNLYAKARADLASCDPDR